MSRTQVFVVKKNCLYHPLCPYVRHNKAFWPEALRCRFTQKILENLIFKYKFVMYLLFIFWLFYLSFCTSALFTDSLSLFLLCTFWQPMVRKKNLLCKNYPVCKDLFLSLFDKTFEIFEIFLAIKCQSWKDPNTSGILF